MSETSLTGGVVNFNQEFDVFQAWKEYEQVAMHFNDLLMRLRTQSLAGVGAFAALAGIILKSEGSPELRWGTLAGVFGLLICFWVAIWILDFMYYNRLLGGAVDALLEIEQQISMRKGVQELMLSTRIEEAVAGSVRAKYWTRAKGWWLFYSVVFVALVAGFIVSIYAIGVSAVITAPKGQQTTGRPTVTTDSLLTKRELFDRKRLCMEMGDQRFAADQKQLGQGMSAITPTVCFSESLNTCLYSSGWIGQGIGQGSGELMTIDLLSKKLLASSLTSKGSVIGMDIAQYQKKSEALFSGCAQ